MRMLSLPLALVLALSLTACKQTQTKKGAETTAASASVPVGDTSAASASVPTGDTTAASTSMPVANAPNGVQPPDLRSPEQKKAEERLKAQKQIMINELNDVLVDLDRQGIKVKKTPHKKPWRLIVPALEKVSEPEQRKAQATKIAEDFRAKVEPLMAKTIDVDVYADDKETQKLN